jgi:menaquinol-cytochrome c reductase iron-sulfur subunit
MERRSLLKWVGGALAGALGVAIAIPAAVFVTFPTRRRTVSGGEEPVDVAAADALPEGVPVRVAVRVRRRRDAWAAFTDVVLGGAWLIRRGDAVRAYSTVCPHAGCAVDWDKERDCFACPCHASSFGSDGSVKSGPSPRGLDSLDATIDAGRVSLRWRRFRIGVSGKEPV